MGGFLEKLFIMLRRVLVWNKNMMVLYNIQRLYSALLRAKVFGIFVIEKHATVLLG